GPYSVVLAKVDIVSNKNSYYKIQLLESDEAKKKHQYWVYRAWGRIGTDIGGDKLEKFKLKSNAIDNFCEVFLEHTGNEWKKKKEFKKLPGRYHIVETHYGNSLDDDKKLVVGNSCLPLPVQDLITMIFDISRMKHQMQEFHLDLAKMPLGKISKDQVMSAYAVLNEISCMIETNEKSLTKMLDASNRFYSLIPHDFGTDNVIVIKNKELLQEKLEMLDSLLEMELAFELVSDIKEEGEDVLKQHYDRLDANIEVLDKNSEEFVIIEKYVKNTHGKTHSQYSLNIINIFIVKRSNEEERYKKYKNLHNRTLLWHGSRVTNYAGILSQGLRIAPPEAPSTGYMFGKGIYFADMVSKSANYCCTTPKDNIGLLLLSEVALGEMWELSDANFVTSLPEGKHSVKGIGKTSPDANEAITLEDGVFVPCGKPIESKKKSTSLLYNEYIVYDVEQVNIKYLLKVEFKYKY
ncbi:poly [ADP-ribose] polymerase 1-like protein, partial [Dinothrombium tinctorium]